MHSFGVEHSGDKGVNDGIKRFLVILAVWLRPAEIDGDVISQFEDFSQLLHNCFVCVICLV